MLVVVGNYSLMAQIHHFETGQTLSQYNYKNSSGVKNNQLTAVSGNKLGLFFKTKKEDVVFGLSYQEQNARGGNGTQIYQWETQYIGPQIKQLYPVNGKLQFALSLGAMFLLDGKQFIDGTQIQLKDNKEFNGLWFHPAIEVNYAMVKLVGLAIYFNYQLNPSFKMGNQGEEKLSFLNHHIGLQFNLLKQTKKVSSDEE
jgi:hypothetical protein